MTLLLTGSDNYNLPNEDFTKSLGGYVSSTPMPNNRINSLFGEISLYTLQNKIPETCALVLWNEGLSAITNISLKYIYPSVLGVIGKQCDFKIAAVSLSDNKRMEKISSRYDEPFYAEYHEANFERANVTLTILTPANVGQSIESTSLDFTSDSCTVSSIDETVSKILEQFPNSSFTATKIATDKIFFEQIGIGEISLTADISATGLTYTFDKVVIENTTNNSVVISSSLAAGTGIGLWLKRTPLDSSFDSDEQLYEDFQSEKVKTTLENIEFCFEWT